MDELLGKGEPFLWLVPDVGGCGQVASPCDRAASARIICGHLGKLISIASVTETLQGRPAVAIWCRWCSMRAHIQPPFADFDFSVAPFATGAVD